MFIGVVNIQVIGIHRSDHGYLRMKVEKRTIKFIGFQHYPVTFSQEQVGIIIFTDPSEKSRTIQHRLFHYMSDHGGSSGFTMGTGHSHRSHMVGDHAQYLCTFVHGVSLLSEITHPRMFSGQGRSINNQGIRFFVRIPKRSRDGLYPIIKNNLYAFFFQGIRNS